ncbi:UNVERIFIED_CONTAM: hypothetical protein PYX00_010990 [Menopon gallinae]|uniref:Thioredoxin n=1 Tax=Menopon gallinae TaxID=328185 RepID=A0AAW2H6S7_9NEOP
MAIEIISEDFAQIIQSHELVLIDFWAPWCAPCRILAPIIDDLTQELSKRVWVGKVNIDQEFDIAKQLGITSIPTLVLFKNGKSVHRMAGVQTKEQILAVLQQFF